MNYSLNRFFSKFVYIFFILFIYCAKAATESPKEAILKDAIVRASSQYTWMLKQIHGSKMLPRSFEHNKRMMVKASDWTSGFFPGSLWLLYELTHSEQFKNNAEYYTRLLETEQFDQGTHDIGFMLYCSSGNAYRITHETYYKNILLNGAKSLSTRFNSNVGGIKSWDTKPWTYPIIIDNMMNLELLTWASHETGLSTYKLIATAHADLSLRNHFRLNGSSYHVVDYNPVDGRVIQKRTHQGAADNSSWARGQSWAIYGYTMMYRETGNIAYLKQAQKTALLFINYPTMPIDGVPFWDYNAPNIPNELRDSSAAAIMCSALFELSDFSSGTEKQIFLNFAWKQLTTLMSENYLASVGLNGGFLLMHATGHHPKNSEMDVPLNYADYYFLESLLRAKNHVN
jgi:unsaturated chondroitin disaccharide hydrolase